MTKRVYKTKAECESLGWLDRPTPRTERYQMCLQRAVSGSGCKQAHHHHRPMMTFPGCKRHQAPRKNLHKQVNKLTY